MHGSARASKIWAAVEIHQGSGKFPVTPTPTTQHCGWGGGNLPELCRAVQRARETSLCESLGTRGGVAEGAQQLSRVCVCVCACVCLQYFLKSTAVQMGGAL